MSHSSTRGRSIKYSSLRLLSNFDFDANEKVSQNIVTLTIVESSPYFFFFQKAPMSTCPSPSPQSIAGAKRGKEKVALRALLPPPPSPTARWVPRNMGGKEGGRHFIGNKSLSGEEGERREGGVICEDSGTEREEKGSRAATDPFFSHSSLLFFSDWENGRCQFASSGLGPSDTHFAAKKERVGGRSSGGKEKSFAGRSVGTPFLGGSGIGKRPALSSSQILPAAAGGKSLLLNALFLGGERTHKSFLCFGTWKGKATDVGDFPPALLVVGLGVMAEPLIFFRLRFPVNPAFRISFLSIKKK